MAETYEQLVSEVEAQGIATAGMDQDKVLSVAKALKLELPFMVRVVEYTPKRGKKQAANYAETSAFKFVNAKGEADTAQGLFVRVEVIDRAIEALQTAKAMLEAPATDGEG